MTLNLGYIYRKGVREGERGGGRRARESGGGGRRAREKGGGRRRVGGRVRERGGGRRVTESGKRVREMQF